MPSQSSRIRENQLVSNPEKHDKRSSREGRSCVHPAAEFSLLLLVRMLTLSLSHLHGLELNNHTYGVDILKSSRRAGSTVADTTTCDWFQVYTAQNNQSSISFLEESWIAASSSLLPPYLLSNPLIAISNIL